MASFGYTPAKVGLAKAEIDLATDDIRVLLVMTNTTADTEQDAEFVGDISVLDEYDGAAYARKALASQVVNQDDPNNRAEFDAADVTWTALGAGTRQCQAAVVFKFVTNDADSPIIAYLDTGGFPFAGNGADVVAIWNAEGIIQVT